MKEKIDTLIAEYQKKTDEGDHNAHAAVCVLRMLAPKKIDITFLRDEYTHIQNSPSPNLGELAKQCHDGRKAFKLEALKRVADMMEEEA